MSKKYKCSFSVAWLQDKQYKHWLHEFKGDKSKCMCTSCDKLIDIGSMGESALKSHLKSEKHIRSTQALSSNGTIKSFFHLKSSETDANNNSLTIPPPPLLPSSSTSSTNETALNKFVIKDSVLKAEILWTIRLITTHQSFKSSENSDKMLQEMFPDSMIAKQFKCGERKAAYLAVFGIAEHFKKLMLQQIKGAYVIIFDESLNKKMHQKQMDLIIRFWNDELNRIETRYYSSEFMGHAKSSDMVDHFTKAMGQLDRKRLIQLGMDGPNVNWKFFDMMQKKLETEHGTNLLNIGSCGLHVVHNSFKTGFVKTGWGIGDFLASLYYLFKDSPARREDYLELSGSKLLPLKFVQHRWLENVPVVERTIAITENIAAYVKAVEKKKVSNPANKSFEVVKKHIKDKLLLPKLHFFKFVALLLQPFLTVYQTNNPLIVFLSDDMSSMLRSIMKLFINHEKIEATDCKLAKMNISDTHLHVDYKHVDIGFSAGKCLREAEGSERQKLELKMEGKTCLIEILKKLLTKAPISYPAVRYLSCFNPVKMAKQPLVCKENFRKLLTLLLNSKTGLVKEDECDKLVQQYSAFLENISVMGRDKFSDFDKKQQCVDEFFSEKMSSTEYKEIFSLVKVLLLLSHGQAAVERGFSINKEVEVENLKRQGLIAQRIICDQVNNVGGISNIIVTDALLKEARLARQRYERYLEDERQNKKSQEALEQRKRKLEELEELKTKKQKLETGIDELEKASDKLYDKAESCEKIEFVKQANSMKRIAREKQEQLKEIEEKITASVKSLKQI